MSVCVPGRGGGANSMLINRKVVKLIWCIHIVDSSHTVNHQERQTRNLSNVINAITETAIHCVFKQTPLI